MMRPRLTAVLAVSCLFLVSALFFCGCEDDDNPQGFATELGTENSTAEMNVTGVWALTLAGEGGRTLTIEQTGARLDGFMTETFEGDSVQQPLSGSVDGNLVDIRTTVGTNSVEMDGVATGAAMNGRFRNHTIGGFGNWSAVR